MLPMMPGVSLSLKPQLLFVARALSLYDYTTVRSTGMVCSRHVLRKSHASVAGHSAADPALFRLAISDKGIA